VIEHFDEVSWVAFSMSICGCAFLFVSAFLKKKFSKRHPKVKLVPEIFIVVILGIIVTASFRLDKSPVNLPVLGEMAQTLPAPKWPGFGGLSGLAENLPSSMTIGLIGFIESCIVAKMYATKHNYSVSSNRELVALGMANLFGSFFSTYPTFGSLPRSYISDLSGAQSQMFSLVVAVFTLITVLPRAIMASVLIVSACGLIHLEDVKFYWKLRSAKDLVVFFVTFLVTILLGVELGIIIGLGLSILLLIKMNSSMHVDLLGHIPNTKSFKPMTEFSEAVPVPVSFISLISIQL
jgi:MFS superfamily sulfate permease-like transporter